MKNNQKLMISKMILLLLGSFYIIVFSGLSLNWVENLYDEWRLLSLILLIILAAYAILNFFLEPLDFPKLFRIEQRKKINIILIVAVICGYCSIPLYQYSTLALVDYSIYILFVLAGVGLYHVFCIFMSNNVDVFRKTILFFSLIPVFIIVLFVFSFFLFYSNGLFFDWKPQFSNMRPYDSIMIVFIFLIWYAAYLFPKYTSLLGLISSLYLLSLLFDGARSAFFGILISLVIAFFTHSKSREFFYLPIISIAIGIFLYSLNRIVSSFLFLETSHKLLRESTSGRWELWVYAAEKWSNNPLIGIGGGSFNYNVDVYKVMSPHNVPIQLIAEWGVAGLFFLYFIFYILYFIYLNRRNIHPLLYSAIVAVFLDANFTGALIHPVQMLTILVIFSFVLANIQKNYTQNSNGNFNFINFLYLSVFLFSVFSIVYVHGSDFICVGCASSDDFHAPRFWEYGRSLNLVPVN